MFAAAMLLFAAAFPGVGFAKNKDADAMCPQGGVVGQKCQDTTNGYTTQGHCTHINECAADSFPMSPKGQGGSSPAPYTGPMGPAPTPPAPAKNVGAYGSSSPLGGYDIINAAFNTPSASSNGGSTGSIQNVRFVDKNGVEYLVTLSETLRVGDALTPADNAKPVQTSIPTTAAPAAAPVKQNQTTYNDALKNVRALNPGTVQQDQQNANMPSLMQNASGDSPFSSVPGWSFESASAMKNQVSLALCGIGLLLLIIFFYRWDRQRKQDATDFESQIPSMPFTANSHRLRTGDALKRKRQES